MLPLHTLLKQLTNEQLLLLESNLQQAVSFNNKTLLIFNCAMIGLNTDETIKECCMSTKAYYKYSRAIYNTVNDLFGLKAESQADKLLAEVHYAIHNEEFKTDKERAERLELFFHLLKKNQLEQESYLLLAELNLIYKGSPLEAVYNHLHLKYSKFRKANEKAFDFFIEFNKKLSNYCFGLTMEEKEKAVLVKGMIQDYRVLRAMMELNENNTLKAIFLLLKLSLVQICEQKQLLLEGQSDLSQLIEESRATIDSLPFGIGKSFLKDIFLQLEIYSTASQNKNYTAASQQNNNNYFDFPELIKTPSEQKTITHNGKKIKVISHSRFIKYRKISDHLSDTISTINLPRGTMTYSLS